MVDDDKPVVHVHPVSSQAGLAAIRHGVTLAAAEPSRLLNPDCEQGKHAACAGDAWDQDADERAACECTCHMVLAGAVA